MRILKIKVNGLKLFPNDLEVDFTTTQRIRNDKSEMLHKISPQIHQNNAIAFVGINASGKTTTLKVISFIIQMLNNDAINSVKNNSILNGLSGNDKIVFDIYFSVFSESIYRLETTITKNILSDDLENNFVIESETLWKKDIKSIRAKKNIFNFSGIEPIQIRKGDEEFLPDDVSIMISLNKKNNIKINYEDLINWTNINLIRILGDFPQELIAFLDSSIEYLKTHREKEGGDIEIRLKFKGKSEILMNSPLELAKYLSSGTIKGINVFVNAMMVLRKGGYLIIDEIENHFNKELAATLVRFFMSHKVNKNGAVILLSTHYPELLDEFERSDNIYVTRNDGGISVENLSKILKRNDIKKSEVYQSGYLEGTVPTYESFIKFKKALIQFGVK
ncbi:AAA family ATPase [Psychromonas sp. MB-3u-54]|uniref:AAA family ATPase n=1 Tax=Psychromonas sp. MB-3u-54 TaxID=2058319 RepID=UPI000C3261F7|nr:ATP-binding protein [Psychromonas sp. MB-3u-54]PKH02541.1 AAA family ATPase [Psychromonas sp. MB-3u-54]